MRCLDRSRDQQRPCQRLSGKDSDLCSQPRYSLQFALWVTNEPHKRERECSKYSVDELSPRVRTYSVARQEVLHTADEESLRQSSVADWSWPGTASGHVNTVAPKRELVTLCRTASRRPRPHCCFEMRARYPESCRNECLPKPRPHCRFEMRARYPESSETDWMSSRRPTGSTCVVKTNSVCQGSPRDSD